MEGQTTGGAIGPTDPVAGEDGLLSGIGYLLNDLLEGRGLLDPVDDPLADATDATAKAPGDVAVDAAVDAAVDVAVDVAEGVTVGGDLAISGIDQADGEIDGGIVDAILGDGGLIDGPLPGDVANDHVIDLAAGAEAQAALDLSLGGAGPVSETVLGVDLHLGGDAGAAEVTANIAVDLTVEPLVEVGIESDLVLDAGVFSGLKNPATVNLDFAHGGLLEEQEISVSGAGEAGQSTPALLEMGLGGARDLFPEVQGDGDAMAEADEAEDDLLFFL